jgi:hypothetical protein
VASTVRNLANSLRGIGAGISAGNRHIRAGLAESQRNRPAYAPRAAGHQCRFAAEDLRLHHKF